MLKLYVPPFSFPPYILNMLYLCACDWLVKVIPQTNQAIAALIWLKFPRSCPKSKSTSTEAGHSQTEEIFSQSISLTYI